MQALYSNFGTLHNVVVHLHGWQQRCARITRILANLHAIVDDMQAWMMKYKGAPLQFPKMMRANAVEMKQRIQSQIENYEELSEPITSI